MGCGWLGLPLAKELVKRGYKVYGSTRSPEKLSTLEDSSIKAFRIDLDPPLEVQQIQDFLRDLELLIVNIPPAMRRKGSIPYFPKIQWLYEEIKKTTLKKIVFVSSTSVYGNLSGEITEDDEVKPVTKSAEHLFMAEQLLQNDQSLEVSIIRFGGLIGPGRHPVNQLSGKTGLENGDDALNLIHLDDCIRMILAIIENNWWGEVFNGVYPDHPLKSDYYPDEAIKRGLPPPEYKNVSGRRTGKIIISRNFLIKNQHFYTSIHS